jgi:hypothetical protein
VLQLVSQCDGGLSTLAALSSAIPLLHLPSIYFKNTSLHYIQFSSSCPLSLAQSHTDKKFLSTLINLLLRCIFSEKKTIQISALSSIQILYASALSASVERLIPLAAVSSLSSMNFALSFFISDIYCGILRLLCTLSSDNYLVFTLVIEIADILLKSAFHVICSFPNSSGVSSTPLCMLNEREDFEVDFRSDDYGKPLKSVEPGNSPSSLDMYLPLPPSHTNLLSMSIHFSMKIVISLFSLNDRPIKEACTPLVKTVLSLTSRLNPPVHSPHSPYLPSFSIPFYSLGFVPFIRVWFYSTDPDLRRFSLCFMLKHVFGLQNLPSSKISCADSPLVFYSSSFLIAMLLEFLKAYDTEEDTRNSTYLGFMVSSTLASLVDRGFSSSALSGLIIKILKIFFEVISSPSRMIIEKKPKLIDDEEGREEGVSSGIKSVKDFNKVIPGGKDKASDEHERENILSSTNVVGEGSGKGERVAVENMVEGEIPPDYYFHISEYEEDMTDVWLRMKKQEKLKKEAKEKKKKEIGISEVSTDEEKNDEKSEDDSMDDSYDDKDAVGEKGEHHLPQSKKNLEKKKESEMEVPKYFRSAFPHLSSSIQHPETSTPQLSAACLLAVLFASPSDRQARELSFQKHPFGIEIRTFALEV